jgi:hypothetical protein
MGTRNVTNQLVAGEIAFGCTGIARVFDQWIGDAAGKTVRRMPEYHHNSREHAREWLDRQHYEFGAV